MPTIAQFSQRIKMRHDYSDMIQVRYTHPGGETVDTWVSGEEIMARLKTMSREQLIRSFGRMNFREAKDGLKQEIDRGRQKARQNLKDRLAGRVQDNIGDNLFGDTLADHIRGVAGQTDPGDKEKQRWQEKLTDQAFRVVAIELAWINLEGTLPDEPGDEPNDWI